MDRQWIDQLVVKNPLIQFQANPNKEDCYQQLVSSLPPPLDGLKTAWASWAPLFPAAIEGDGILLFYYHNPPEETLNLCGLYLDRMPDHPNTGEKWGAPVVVGP